MSKRKPAFEEVTIRVSDTEGRTKAWYPSVTAFIDSVIASQHNKINIGESKCNICGSVRIGMAQDCRCTKYGYRSWRQVPRDLRPWYWKWLP